MTQKQAFHEANKLEKIDVTEVKERKTEGKGKRKKGDRTAAIIIFNAMVQQKGKERKGKK